ncbi:bifunctional adenosylcobalamin biosynthesis protein CobU [Clostridiales bacterium]|nr:bifunctional adenosylcobalamin biosynthesis protein CobU [Clostridiales bacterium]
MFILVIGGSGSGKSEFAEDCAICLAKEGPIYIAAMIPYGDEGKKRVLRHRDQREGKGFITKERYFDMKNIKVDSGDTVILECISNLLANEMFEPEGANNNSVSEIKHGIEYIKGTADNFVVVTNDVFCDGIGYSKETNDYIKNLGKINRFMAAAADEVYEVVCGIPILIKGEGICLNRL